MPSASSGAEVAPEEVVLAAPTPAASVAATPPRCLAPLAAVAEVPTRGRAVGSARRRQSAPELPLLVVVVDQRQWPLFIRPPGTVPLQLLKAVVPTLDLGPQEVLVVVVVVGGAPPQWPPRPLPPPLPPCPLQLWTLMAAVAVVADRRPPSPQMSSRADHQKQLQPSPRRRISRPESESPKD